MRLKDSMFRVVNSEETKVKVKLDAGHLIYQAHFPGNPITPGVCIIQMIGELIADRLGVPTVNLHQIINLKYIAPISPVSEPVIELVFSSIEQQDEEVKTKGVITAKGSIVTKFSIVYQTQC